MKGTQRFAGVLAGLLLSAAVFAQARNNWENPQLYEVKKEQPHATFMLFAWMENNLQIKLLHFSAIDKQMLRMLLTLYLLKTALTITFKIKQPII